MVINTVFGFLAHLIRDTATGHMSRSWQDISNYALGVMTVFPLSFFMFITLRHEIRKPELRYVVSYILPFVSFGAGVVYGHWYKPVKE
jgi:hypothetical protein